MSPRPTSAARTPCRAAGPTALVVALALSLTACGGASSAGSDGGSEASPSSSSSGATTAGPTPAPPAPAAPASPAPAAPAPTDVPMLDATAPLAATALGTPPTEVRVEAADVDVPVIPVGIAPDGQTEVPPDANDAGWYRFGPGVGADRGATVILAHAGSEITPRGPFSRLKALGGDEIVVVTGADGTEHPYRVTSVEVLEKQTLDLTPYFVRDGEPHLVLITCGGVWDEAANSYRSNVVVTAVPV
ncbi:class F sortase [Serinibacter arcticus]|uniref:Class F sortase n=1 Tax=Serinibacter arcticus TaxID=1655435 RepID=A0A2U1ZW23_9MICO|nr:class F sortase [Serinibacter arcticus]PWD51178.1 class F sortase [Serinibacter arcticus]